MKKVKSNGAHDYHVIRHEHQEMENHVLNYVIHLNDFLILPHEIPRDMLYLHSFDKNLYEKDYTKLTILQHLQYSIIKAYKASREFQEV